MRPESLATFAKFADKIDAKTADEIAQFEVANLAAVQDLVQELNIDCDFEQIESANAYLDEDLAKAAKRQQSLLADAGFDVVKRFKYHDEATAPTVTGVPAAKGAMTFPAACLWFVYTLPDRHVCRAPPSLMYIALTPAVLQGLINLSCIFSPRL